MILDTKPPIAIMAFRWTVNALAIAGMISLMAYVIPWVAFWAINTLIDKSISMSPEHVAALWVLIFILGFMDKLVMGLTKK